MKRTDIRAGVVYAVKSSYGPPSPIMFLEDGAAGIYSRGNFGRGAPRKLPADYKAKAGRGLSDSGRGYAAIRRNSVGDLTTDEAVERLGAIDPAAELARFLADESPAVDGLRFEIVTSLGQITGLYAEAVTQYEAERKAERERRDQREAALATAWQRAASIRDGLAELGIRSTVVSADYGGSISLSLDEAEKLFALLAAKDT